MPVTYYIKVFCCLLFSLWIIGCYFLLFCNSSIHYKLTNKIDHSIIDIVVFRLLKIKLVFYMILSSTIVLTIQQRLKIDLIRFYRIFYILLMDKKLIVYYNMKFYTNLRSILFILDSPLYSRHKENNNEKSRQK
jgi:hypothetical protein